MNKDTRRREMRVTRFTENGVMVDDGRGWQRPVAEPFRLWSFLGGWKPVCVKHKLLFQRPASYYKDHAYCKGDKFPPSDLAIHAHYKRVWR